MSDARFKGIMIGIVTIGALGGWFTIVIMKIIPPANLETFLMSAGVALVSYVSHGAGVNAGKSSPPNP